VVTSAGCGGLRERKKAQTRDAIIEAALELFERKGYDETTVEEIASAADVSQRTFFRYFESKLEVVMAPKSEEDGHDIESLIAGRPDRETPIEAFRNVVRDELGGVLQAGDLRARQFQVAMRTPSLRSHAHEHFNEHRDEFAAVFAKRLGVPEDDLAPQVMATTVSGVVWTVIDRWVDEGAVPERLMPLLDQAFDLLGPGLG
jgi:AcrR family transcriptional regulator